MGDCGADDHVNALRAATSTGNMTAESYALPREFPYRATDCIISEVRGINRVGHGVTSKAPGAIEWERDVRRTFPLHDLNDTEFEDLVCGICHLILGTGTVVFATGKDGGRDAAFNGTAAKFPNPV
jgi:hypothetical protein